MPDLNELLRWSIENSTIPTAQPANEPLSLRFNPSSTSSGNSALHPSDPLYRLNQNGGDNISEASTPGPTTPDGTSNDLPIIPKRNDLNSDILDVIMGKSDSVTMKEKMDFALNEENDVEDRVGALDDLEMLIELIDNANNMAVLKLWEPLLSLLNSPHEEIIAHACWIMGTAIQNNLKAQAAFFLHNALPLVLPIIHSPSSSRTYSTSTRSRATYCISSSLKHWPLASSILSSSSDQGYTILAAGVKDQAPQIRRKTAFLVNTLVLQSDEKYTGEIPSEVQNLLEERMKELGTGGKSESLIEGLKRTGVFKNLLEALKETEDVEFEENAIRALVAAAQKGGLASEEVVELKNVWKSWGNAGQEERGLGGQDGQDISNALR